MATKKKLLQAAAGTAAAGGGGLNVEDVFSTYLYEGNGSTQTITNGIDLAGEGGLVWIKDRSGAYSHNLVDSERGVNNYLFTDLTSAQFDAGSLRVSSFNSDGFSLGSGSNGTNRSANNHASWTFRKAPKFFDVVTYTGTGSSLTIDHNLGVEPAVIIIKRTNTTGNWIVFTDVVDGSMDYLYLNTTDASADGSALLSKSSTSFTLLQSFLYGNASGSEYVAYLFAHNDGDGDFGPDGDADIIKCGSVTYTTGATVDLGFEPQWVLVKPSSSTGNWILNDVMRGMPNGSRGPWLIADTNAAELANATVVYPTSTGFTMPSGLYTNSTDLIYIAIRRPMAVPTDATEVFAIDEMDNSPTAPPTLYSGFPVDMAFYTNKSASSDRHISSRMIGDKLLQTNQTNAEIDYTYAEWDFMDGWFSYAGALSNYYSWMWKRAPNYFDVVAYTGDGVAGRTVSHNLGVAPEMMWVKSRSAANNWNVYHSALGATKRLKLDTTDAASTLSTIWNDTAPTDSVFSVGAAGGVNGSSTTYIAYLFASLDGISKCGSYTGNGSSQTIDCGFSSGARFVLIKCTDTNLRSWCVWDSERGIVAGADPVLTLESTQAEGYAENGAGYLDYSSIDWIDPHSSGFTLAGGYGVTNELNKNYIFYAIA